MSHTLLEDLKKAKDALVKILKGVGGVWASNSKNCITLKDVAVDLDAIQKQLSRLTGVDTRIGPNDVDDDRDYQSRAPSRSPSPPKKTKRHRIILQEEEDDEDDYQEKAIVRRGRSRSRSPTKRYKREISVSPPPPPNRYKKDVSASSPPRFRDRKVPTEEERARREKEEELSVYLRYIPLEHDNEDGEVELIPKEPFLTKEAQKKEEDRLCKDIFVHYGNTRRAFVWAYNDKKNNATVPVARVLFHDVASRQAVLQKKDEIAGKYLLQVSTTKYE